MRFKIASILNGAALLLFAVAFSPDTLVLAAFILLGVGVGIFQWHLAGYLDQQTRGRSGLLSRSEEASMKVASLIIGAGVLLFSPVAWLNGPASWGFVLLGVGVGLSLWQLATYLGKLRRGRE